MYILQNPDRDRIVCFICSPISMTVTEVTPNGLTKVTSSNVRFGLNKWADLKEEGWVELERPTESFADLFAKELS